MGGAAADVPRGEVRGGAAGVGVVTGGEVPSSESDKLEFEGIRGGKVSAIYQIKSVKK